MDRFITNMNLSDIKYLCLNNGVYMINYNNLEDCEIDHMVLHDW